MIAIPPDLAGGAIVLHRERVIDGDVAQPQRLFDKPVGQAHRLVRAIDELALGVPPLPVQSVAVRFSQRLEYEAADAMLAGEQFVLAALLARFANHAPVLGPELLPQLGAAPAAIGEPR